MEQLNQFKTWLDVNTSSKNTSEAYFYQMKCFFDFSKGEINSDLIQKYFLNILESKQSASKFNLTRYAFKKFFEFSKTTFDIPKKQKGNKRLIEDFITEKELDEILSELPRIFQDPFHVETVLKVLFYTGLRKGELCNLKRSDIKLEEYKIIVRDTKGDQDAVINFPKSIRANMIAYFAKEQEITNAFNVSRAEITNWLNKINVMLKPRVKLHPHLFRHCVSADTQILTIDGWKNYNEVEIGDKVFSYNMNKNKIQLDNILNKHIYNYNDKIYHLKSCHIDSFLTSEHKNVFHIAEELGSKPNTYLFWNKKKLLSLIDFLNFQNKRMAHQIISGNFNGKKSIGEERAFIIGMVLTDGYLDRKQAITISQSWTGNKNKCLLIEEKLNKSGITYTKCLQKPQVNYFNKKLYQMVIYRIFKKNSKWIFDWITLDNKPKYKLLQLKNKELNALYDGLMTGDGCRNSEFCDQDKYKIDFFRVLCVLINKRTTYLLNFNKSYTGGKKHRTYISKNNFVSILPNKHISTQNYNGIVWCPATKNETWIARRNETIFITGNSSAKYLIQKTGDIQGVQKQLRHTDIKTTLRYSERTEDMQSEWFHKHVK